QYIRELESENRRLTNELSEASKQTRAKLFLDEATKTLAGWQAWSAVAAGALFVASQFGGSAEALGSCLESISPSSPELFEPLTEI
ncbi:hypothetical protein M3P21_14820, partial [Ruegeria sp. 2012CJ41-6]